VEATGLMQSLLSLLFVVGAIFALAWLLRRMQNLKPRGAGALRLHGGLSVGNRERVLWLEAGGKHLLIGVAPGRVQTLHVFDQAPLLPAETLAASQAPNFGDLLKRALGREAP
jgi:flagellar protein FliO/FliZ